MKPLRSVPLLVVLLAVATTTIVRPTNAEPGVPNPRFLQPQRLLPIADSFQDEELVDLADDEEGPSLGLLKEAVRGAFPSPLWDSVRQTFRHLSAAMEDAAPEDEKNSQVRDYNWLQMIAPYYLPNITMVSPDCKRDINALSWGFLQQKSWALNMVDSWGKLPDGIMAGNIEALGLLDECLGISVDLGLPPPTAHFTGRYCSMSFSNKPNPNNTKRTIGEEEEEKEDMEAYQENVLGPALHMANIKGLLRLAMPYNRISTCIPSTCTKEEYQESLMQELDKSEMEVVNLACQTNETPQLQFNAGEIIFIIFLCVMGILVIVGTVADVWMVVRKNGTISQGPLRFFLVFSFYTNLIKIFRINVSENKEVISCLHGIRVLSMCWVVLCHAYIFSLLGSANKFLAQDIFSTHLFLYQVIFNGYPSVDTFFFMSGLLVAYNLTKEFQKTSRFNIPLYYIHRFIRLAPPILLLCGFFAVFPPLFVRGSASPLLVEPHNLVDNCRKYWWRDAFFITNFFIGVENGESCVPVCWYTAVDFQLYIVTPLIFLPILYRYIVGKAWLIINLLASCIIPATIIGVMQLPPTNVMDVPLEDSGDMMKYVYTKPWCRASPYLVGLCLGYFLRVVDRDKINLKWWQTTIGWVISLSVSSAVVFGMMQYNTLSGVPHDYYPATSIIYGGFHRLAWGLTLAWLVFACHLGYGGPINGFLAHPFWQPFSRLTYSTFLIALNYQTIYYTYHSRLPIYFTQLDKVMETAGTLLISGMCAVLLSLLAESPVMGLEKLLLRKENSK